MGRNKVSRVVVHTDKVESQLALTERVSEFHAGIIERRLRESGLTTDIKIEVINGIIESFREQEREKDGGNKMSCSICAKLVEGTSH